MSNKYVVEYTTVNPVYTEGAKMWKAVRWITVAAIAAWILF